jgi:retron-type reverse transcriptase
METFLRIRWKPCAGFSGSLRPDYASRMRKDAAHGVDRISAEEYEQHLTENIHNLVERLKRRQYRAKLVRRRNVSAQCWVSG